MTEYEVKCPQTWAWYTGYVHDYNEREKKLYIKYADDWKSPEWLDITSVRYKYDVPLMSTEWRPSYNEEVECKARAEEREPYGWWPCKAIPYKDSAAAANASAASADADSSNLYSVAFIGWGNEHNEILGIEFIRKKSSSAVLFEKNMHKELYSVPVELKDWVLTHCANKTILDTLMPHKNISSQIIHITYLESSNKLLLIGVKRVLLTMKDIIYCFFEKQKSLLRLEQKTNELELKSKLKKEEELKAEKHTFNVHPLLSGYLRGKKGTNIDQVKRRNNKIIRVEPQNGSCYIAAKDKTSLNDAIDALYVVCKKVIIPKHEMGQIIGSHGQQIQDIKRKSEVIKVISWKLWPKEFNTLLDIQTKRYTTQQSYQSQQQQLAQEDTEAADEMNDDIPDIIKNATIDNIFDENDIIDLSTTKLTELNNNNNVLSTMDESIDQELNVQQLKNNAYETEMDALVIIGRKSRVELCIFMIEMTLNHFRQITKTRNNVRLLRQKINQIKGNPMIHYNRDQRGGRVARNRENESSAQAQSGQRGRERERERERGRGSRNRYQQRQTQRYQRRDRNNEPQQQYDEYDDNQKQEQQQQQQEQEAFASSQAQEAIGGQETQTENQQQTKRGKRHRARKRRKHANRNDTPQ